MKRSVSFPALRKTCRAWRSVPSERHTILQALRGLVELLNLTNTGRAINSCSHLCSNSEAVWCLTPLIPQGHILLLSLKILHIELEYQKT